MEVEDEEGCMSLDEKPRPEDLFPPLLDEDPPTPEEAVPSEEPGSPSEDVPAGEATSPTQAVPSEEPPKEEKPAPKKRGKKKKLVSNVPDTVPLPPDVVADLTPEKVIELQEAYRILQVILRISKIEPFLERPDENLFGMSSYYNIIKKPMWLNEVEKKLLSGKYEGIAEFVSDIRLILENCYRFWGPNHKFSRKALFIEHKLDVNISLLSEDLRDKCEYLEADWDKMEINNEDEQNDDEPDYEPKSREKSVTLTSIKGFESKILKRVLESEDSIDSEDIEEQNRREEEMLAWEREHLVSITDRELIKSMWQLAVIGSFLKLTYDALHVGEITQYEVERMLLMPRESMTLATLMTSMLSPQVQRSRLESDALMPYDIWTERLKKRINSWFHIFYAGDEIQAFIECGVEPAFWTYINLTNPLDNAGFHEIPFLQRVWIFKSLCDNIMHTDKPIQECINNNTTRELRPLVMGKDKLGNTYFQIPFVHELRIYKQARLPHNVYDSKPGKNFHEEFLSKYMEETNDIIINEDEQELEVTPSVEDCYLVADSVDSFTDYINKLKENKQVVLARSFTSQLKLIKNKHRKNIDGLIALHTQWHEFQTRSEAYFSHMKTLWSMKHNHRNVDYLNSGNDNTKKEEVLGKRRCKRTQNTDFMGYNESDSNDAGSSEDYESDVSDWEPSKNKKKKKTEKERKEDTHVREESNVSEPEEESNSTLSILDVRSLQEDEKLAENNVSIKIEHDSCENSIPSVASPQMGDSLLANHLKSNAKETPSSVSSASQFVVKKEKDDVICISSDEEEENTKSSHNAITDKLNGIISPVLSVGGSSAVSITKRWNSSPQSTPQQSIPQPIPVAAVPQPIPEIAKPFPVPQPIPIPKPIAVPQPIPIPQPIQATPPKKPGVPMPIPSPPQRRYPLPIPEPSWPQPIKERMPHPFPSPRGVRPMPRTPTSPLTPRAMRMRSPVLSPRSPLLSPRNPSPRMSPLSNALNPMLRSPIRSSAVRNLFPNAATAHTVEGVLEIGQKPDGSYGYHVRLPDGGIINMNRQEIDEIRRKNNGVLPVKLEVPLTKNKKF